jgi:hypothetical protein
MLLLMVAKVVSSLGEGLSGKSGLPLSALGSLLMRGSINVECQGSGARGGSGIGAAKSESRGSRGRRRGTGPPSGSDSRSRESSLRMICSIWSVRLAGLAFPLPRAGMFGPCWGGRLVATIRSKPCSALTNWPAPAARRQTILGPGVKRRRRRVPALHRAAPSPDRFLQHPATERGRLASI